MFDAQIPGRLQKHVICSQCRPVGIRLIIALILRIGIHRLDSIHPDNGRIQRAVQLVEQFPLIRHTRQARQAVREDLGGVRHKQNMGLHFRVRRHIGIQPLHIRAQKLFIRNRDVLHQLASSPAVHIILLAGSAQPAKSDINLPKHIASDKLVGDIGLKAFHISAAGNTLPGQARPLRQTAIFHVGTLLISRQDIDHEKRGQYDDEKDPQQTICTFRALSSLLHPVSLFSDQNRKYKNGL